MPDVALSSPPDSAPRGSDKVFTVALALVVAFGALEILAASIHFVRKYRAEHAAARPARSATPAPTAAPVASGAAAPAQARSAATPTSAALSASDRLLKEAAALRERGDTANALARLQDASQRDPQNPQVLAELATIYESIQLFDRSNETWRKIEEIGPSAGPLYELAENRLRTGVAPVSPRPQTADGTGKPLDAEGIPEGSIFGIANVATEPVPDPDAETNVRLRIDVRKRPGIPYEVGKLRINVFLYDLLDESRVVLTDADTSSEWLSPTHDWSNGDTETLIVSYRRSKTHAMTSESAISAAAAAVTPGKLSARSKKRADSSAEPQLESEAGNRRYLGYLIRVYYNDKLQTVRADPPRLVNDAPPASSSP